MDPTAATFIKYLQELIDLDASENLAGATIERTGTEPASPDTLWVHLRDGRTFTVSVDGL